MDLKNELTYQLEQDHNLQSVSGEDFHIHCLVFQNSVVRLNDKSEIISNHVS